jgi:hypothetical protein
MGDSSNFAPLKSIHVLSFFDIIIPYQYEPRLRFLPLCIHHLIPCFSPLLHVRYVWFTLESSVPTNSFCLLFVLFIFLLLVDCKTSRDLSGIYPVKVPLLVYFLKCWISKEVARLDVVVPLPAAEKVAQAWGGRTAACLL